MILFYPGKIPTTQCKKVSTNMGILNKIKANVNNYQLLTLYNSLILPYFNYCNIVWAACKSIYLDRNTTEKKLFI